MLPVSINIAIPVDIPRQVEKMWNGFELSYEGLLTLIDRVEQTAETLHFAWNHH